MQCDQLQISARAARNHRPTGLVMAHVHARDKPFDSAAGCELVARVQQMIECLGRVMSWSDRCELGIACAASSFGSGTDVANCQSHNLRVVRKQDRVTEVLLVDGANLARNVENLRKSDRSNRDKRTTFHFSGQA
jgi:hypothetical protein